MATTAASAAAHSDVNKLVKKQKKMSGPSPKLMILGRKSLSTMLVPSQKPTTVQKKIS